MQAVSSQTKGLSGVVDIPGDKSISHRALMFGALATGQTTVSGLLESEDVLNTKQVLNDLGVSIEKQGDFYVIDGVGLGGFRSPMSPLNCGNSGTSMRLLAGLIAGQQIGVTLMGDESLSKRPMKRIMVPLSQMGANLDAEEGGKPPLSITPAPLKPIAYELPVASAQVKSCVLLAGLGVDGETTVIETEKSRDHTEKMLKAFGADIRVEEKDGQTHITIKGGASLSAQEVHVPADPSSAAFFMVAGLIVPNSEITLKNIMLNPTRIGLVETLIEMGGDIEITDRVEKNGEEVGTITVKSSALKGVNVPASRAPSMIDEYPILSVAAACAKGETVMNGIEELRVKETDRVAAMEAGLEACGVNVTSNESQMIVSGNRDAIKGNATITTHMDHRIAMSFLVLGLVAQDDITIDDISMIDTSFPTFIDQMVQIGADIETNFE